MLMARPPFRLFLLTLVAVLALVGVRGAAAAPLRSASGTFTTTSATFNSARSADGNMIIDLSAMLSYTGTFNGTSTLHGILIFHPNGSANFHDVETFTGTVNGVPGSVTFNLAGTGRPGPSAGTFVYQATQVIVSGTGDLANLHGVLTQVGTVPAVAAGPLGTYSGEIHFDQ
jgi:hypothetical protein